jgi:hypothetical protein
MRRLAAAVGECGAQLRNIANAMLSCATWQTQCSAAQHRKRNAQLRNIANAMRALPPAVAMKAERFGVYW